MESKNFIVVFVWIFAIVISVALFWVGADYVAGIGGPFIASILLFIIAIIASAVIVQGNK